MASALIRFRVMAYLVGTVLILLVGVAMPMKYLADRPELVEMIGPVHGFLYIGYLAVAFDLAALRLRWPLRRTALLLLAGTVPVLSFVAERRMTALVRARAAEPVPATHG
jgi:integral membrane protein